MLKWLISLTTIINLIPGGMKKKKLIWEKTSIFVNYGRKLEVKSGV